MKRLAALAALTLTGLVLAGCGGSGDRSAQIGQEIGGSCSETTYGIVSKLDGSKQRIYDCTANGRRMCVTEANGIASDETALARLLFANALSGGKPACLK